MKIILSIFAACFISITYGQPAFPGFLEGTWKAENRDAYEHWDKLNESSLKGFAYKLEEGRIRVTEYLEIGRKNQGLVYTATLADQNQGKGVDFRLVAAEGTWIFINPGHDFPQKIVYRELSANEIFVEVSDGAGKGFSYKMIRQYVPDTTSANPDFDAALAGRLGGDDYGMKSYFLVILKTGTNTTAERALITESFRGHMENINRLVEENKLVVAGPLGKNERQYRGIFILQNIPSEEEARALLLTDPAIRNGLLDYELFNWYGSAALPEYLPASEKIWKLKP
jgi:uncharacterized protein YciI